MQVKVMAGVFVAVLGTAVMIVQGPLLARLWELRQSAATTSGIVVAVDPKDHNRATYRYRANGAEYMSSEVGSFRKEGETATVYYAPGQPWISILDDPDRAFREGVVGTVLLCAFLVAGVTVAALRAR